MRLANQKTTPSTQEFIGIEDVFDNIIALPGKQACQIIEVIATNFSLQSGDEQEVKILTYASLLNSLSFPIQITILSRKLDISSYLALLDNQSRKTESPKLSEHIKNYRAFIADLVKNNDVLDKKFYISIHYSFLEKGAANVGSIKDKSIFLNDAKNTLTSKSLTIINELNRVGLRANILEKNELVGLFYEIFNHEKPDKKLFENIHDTHVSGNKK